MSNDPRTALAVFAGAMLAIVLYVMQYLNVPEPLIPLVMAALTSGARLAEVAYDQAHKPAVSPP
jgi:ABC-type Fe3+-siderophore transport system permease subunit